ncbi:MAG: nuclear transport factor 2 family protein [Gammaproteobacteria bacterium]|nr:nuclear transport factor 2 family protein [Gammaproteobacteria bacterium]
MNPIIEQFCAFYRELSLSRLTDIAEIYSAKIIFEDPVHRLVGRENLVNYFKSLLSNTGQCRFAIDTMITQNNTAFVSWELCFTHSKLKASKPIKVQGVSYLRYSESIDYHRDYYDLGQMIYEQLPLLGTIIRQVKSRLAA